MPNFVSSFVRKMLFGILLLCPIAAWCADKFPVVAQSKAIKSAQSCQALLSPLRALDVQKLAPNEHALYEFEIPGLHILAEVSADPNRFGPRLHRFMLDYNPKVISRLSPYRSILGNQPMQYSEADLRYFGHAFVAGYGPSMEFYLRLPNDLGKQVDQGPLLHVALESGQVFGYAAGTDVDGELEGALRGSIGAIGKFVSGLTTELRFMRRNRHPEAGGQFYIENANAGTEALGSSGIRFLPGDRK